MSIPDYEYAVERCDVPEARPGLRLGASLRLGVGCLSALAILSPLLAQNAGRQPGTPQHQAVKPNVLAQHAAVQLVQVRLSVDRATLQTGERATFSLTPANRATDPALVWTIKVSDGTIFAMGKGESEFQYGFHTAGTYTVSVSVQEVTGGDMIASSRIKINAVTVQVTDVALEVDPAKVVAGIPVTFTTRFQTVPQEQKIIRYRFVLDDGTVSSWSQKSTMRHAYATTGLHHVYVEIGHIGDPFTKSATRDVTVIAPSPEGIRLVADRSQANAGDRVNFTASTLSPHEGIQYQFSYGDGTTSAWLAQSASSHAYKAAGTYTAFVEARFGKRVLKSNSATVTFHWVPPLEWYLGIAGFVFAAAAAAWTYLKRRPDGLRLVPSAHIKPHLDMGTQKLDARSSSGAIRVRMCLRTSLSQGSHSVAVSNCPVIKRQWRENG